MPSLAASCHLSLVHSDHERAASLVRRTEATVLWVADLKLDVKNRTAVRAGQCIPLQRRDFDLLAHLVRHHGRTVPHADLLQNLGGRFREAGTRCLKLRVNRVRRKIDQGFPLQLIHIVPGIGWVLLGERD